MAVANDWRLREVVVVDSLNAAYARKYLLACRPQGSEVATVVHDFRNRRMEVTVIHPSGVENCE